MTKINAYFSLNLLFTQSKNKNDTTATLILNLNEN